MKFLKIIILLLFTATGTFAQSEDLLLKTTLKPEIWVIVAEIEKRTHGEINTAFAEPESGELDKREGICEITPQGYFF